MLILTVVVIQVPGVPGKAIFLAARGSEKGNHRPGARWQGGWAGAWGCLSTCTRRGSRNKGC